MFDEILKTARQHIAERLASPLLGSFSIAWSLWNYKFLVILFSSTSVSRTFELVERVAFPDVWSIVLRGVVLPAATATAYIFVYPYPAKFVYGFTQRRQREINELRQQIEHETPLTIEESRRVRAEILAAEVRHREELDRLNAEIGRLRAQIEDASKSPADSQEVPQTRHLPRISASQILLLKLIEKGGGKLAEGLIVSRSKESKVKTEFDLGELQRSNLLQRDYDQSEGDYTYEFTHEGRRAVIEVRATTESNDA